MNKKYMVIALLLSVVVAPSYGAEDEIGGGNGQDRVMQRGLLTPAEESQRKWDKFFLFSSVGTAWVAYKGVSGLAADTTSSRAKLLTGGAVAMTAGMFAFVGGKRTHGIFDWVGSRGRNLYRSVANQDNADFVLHNATRLAIPVAVGLGAGKIAEIAVDGVQKLQVVSPYLSPLCVGAVVATEVYSSVNDRGYFSRNLHYKKLKSHKDNVLGLSATVFMTALATGHVKFK